MEEAKVRQEAKEREEEKERQRWREDEANWEDEEEELEMLSQKGMKSVSREDVMNMLQFAMSTNLMIDGFLNIDNRKQHKKKIK